jgi:hypothetical protein
MGGILKLTGAAALAFLSFAQFCPHAFAQDSAKPPQEHSHEQRRIKWGFENNFKSGHVWRGLVVSDQPVVQPAAWISASGFTFEVWSNLTLSNTSEDTRPRVTDLLLTYERDWKKLTIEPALQTSFYRDPLAVEASTTMEASLKLSYPVGPLRVFTVHSFDVLFYKGAYFGEAGVTYERKLSERASFEAALRTGWASAKFNDAEIGVSKPAFNFVGVEGAYTYYIRPHVYLQPHFGFSTITDRQLRGALLKPTFFTLGLAMGMDF